MQSILPYCMLIEWRWSSDECAGRLYWEISYGCGDYDHDTPFLSFFGLNSSYRTHIFVNEKKNWKDAQEYCRKHYDDLSTITSQDIQTFCQNSEITEDFFYCGLQRDIRNSGWLWSNGAPATINEWDIAQGSQPGEDCAAIRKTSKKLHDYDCSGKLTFYCMMDLDLIQENKTWDEALDYCIERNTSLASINSSTIMDLVVKMAKEPRQLTSGLACAFWQPNGSGWMEVILNTRPGLRRERCGVLPWISAVELWIETGRFGPPKLSGEIQFFVFHKTQINTLCYW